LESRSDIRDLASDYCHGFDKRDYDRFLSIWWPDCAWDIGPPFGSFTGHEGIHTAVQEVLWPAWKESHHLTTNLRIEFIDADNAEAMCDVDCRMHDCRCYLLRYAAEKRRRMEDRKEKSHDPLF